MVVGTGAAVTATLVRSTVACAVVTAVTGGVVRAGGPDARLRGCGTQSQRGHSQCHDAPCLAQHCFFPLKKCVALRLHYILRDLILAEFLGCVNAVARLIVGFIGFALIRPSGTFSREREKGLVPLVIGCCLRL